MPAAPDDVTIIHVDDDPAAREDVAAALAVTDGVEVRSVETAQAAIDRSETVDCVVSEYDLPDSDGLTLCRDLSEGGSNVPFVLYTGAGDERVASEAFSTGVADYVRKGVTDATERLRAAVEAAVEAHRTAQTLRESEQQYRTLVEGSHEGIYIYKGDEFLFVNDRISEVTGYEREELMGMDPWEIIHPDDRDRVEAIAGRRQRGEDAPNTYQARIQTKGGETRHVEFNVQTVTYEGDWAAMGSARDVTERLRREEQLQKEQTFIETILDTLEDVIFVFGLDGELIRWNDRLCEFTGYDHAELAEMNAFELIADEFHDEAIDEIREGLVTGQGELEAEAETKDGSHIPFEFRGSPLENSAGKKIGIAGVARDISGRLEREAELAQYKTIVEAVGDPVYTLDADGNLTLANDALCELTGYEEGELVGQHVSKVMPAEDIEKAKGLIEQLLSDPETTNVTIELAVETVDGETIPCEDQVALLPTDDGEFRGTAGVLRDISDRKEREQRLRRQNEQLDQFASVVSHDLRNPLNVVLGRLEAAEQTGEAVHFEKIRGAALRMEEMIDDLLTLAREGQEVGEVEPVALSAVVERAWENVDTREMSLALADDSGRVLADRDRVTALIENLFRNAVKHAGESVTVSVSPIDDDGFYVADDGPGIPEDDWERVFEQGYSTGNSGTGLGLVIVRSIADAHGWNVAVTESEAGGARFEITGVEFSGD